MKSESLVMAVRAGRARFGVPAALADSKDASAERCRSSGGNEDDEKRAGGADNLQLYVGELSRSVDDDEGRTALAAELVAHSAPRLNRQTGQVPAEPRSEGVGAVHVVRTEAATRTTEANREPSLLSRVFDDFPGGSLQGDLVPSAQLGEELPSESSVVSLLPERVALREKF